ncbi:gibberellin 2-beta-dioxygenase 1-like [Sesamum indicum]|uniref:gibberellin 2beta-dioxygenase n=1 Tax=Sesamum indicum TaxID=4182 RepID=A0A6I9TP25_SESIN|nr:gibberellin 2-beta-dioxygenase 1-like [Sesamum indicum]
MVVLSKPAFDHFKNCTTFFPGIPLVDLSRPDSKTQLVKACEEFGFFKVVNHGVPIPLIKELESEAVRFFSLPHSDKAKAGPPDPFGYGDKRIGPNGDVGWVEYLLLTTNTHSGYQKFASIFGEAAENFRRVVNEYVLAVRRMACEILEMLADGLKIQPRNAFSKLLMDEKSDSVFRLNHYPPRPQAQLQDQSNGRNLIGFGEHTDPQIISVLRSNNTSGLQISLKDGSWIPVPPDQTSFFINVGDSLQVMTNGRFKSVRHRVVANSSKSRLSMIYFGGPPLSEKIAPLAALMEGEEDSLYKEFTWFEYKNNAYKTRLADNRLGLFEKIAAS